VGMDVHKSITMIVVLNELGQFESRSQVKTKGENICGSHGYRGPNARRWVRSRRRSPRRRNVPSRSRVAGDRRAKM
jgi:hypothetical protein